jgi:hypothetical protein
MNKEGYISSTILLLWGCSACGCVSLATAEINAANAAILAVLSKWMHLHVPAYDELNHCEFAIHVAIAVD